MENINMTNEVPQENTQETNVKASPELSFADIRVALEAIKVAGERRSYTLEESVQVYKTVIAFQEFADFVQQKEEESKAVAETTTQE
jgi:hypothetical protein